MKDASLPVVDLRVGQLTGTLRWLDPLRDEYLRPVYFIGSHGHEVDVDLFGHRLKVANYLDQFIRGRI